MILTLMLLIGFALAYANGANDVSKGIATLVGSGVANHQRAIVWGTIWTGVGGVAGAFLARAMIQTFGTGLLAPGFHASISAAFATLAGAALWVAWATWRGLPVSTTHAILGSIAGTAVLAYGWGGVNWISLGGKIALPLLLSPIVALALTSTLLSAWKKVAAGSVQNCICAELAPPMELQSCGEAVLYASAAVPQLHLATCKANPGMSPGITQNHLHWLSSGATSFARGLNDVPKMVAILLSAALLSGIGFVLPLSYFLVISLGVVLGSWIAGQRITQVLACDVTQMDHREGLVANLTTATLVGVGAAFGWPMSTTHVASGAIFGIASGKTDVAKQNVWNVQSIHARTIRAMLAAWVITLPGAAIFGAAVYVLLHAMGLR